MKSTPLIILFLTFVTLSFASEEAKSSSIISIGEDPVAKDKE